MKEISELYTIRDFLRWAMSRFNEAGLFYGHGTDNAWDEAIALILHTLYLPHDINPALLEARLTVAEREILYKIIERRIHERIPLAYLTHEAWFAHLLFYVDERVLVPRSSLAELIENQFQPWIDTESVHHILDLCTGSGCIAIASAHYFPSAKIDASDISHDALAVAKINILKHEMEDQVKLFQGDLFKPLANKKYDIIVSNPPYVDAEDMASLPREYQHEPKLGLQAGILGLDVVTRILHKAADHLNPEGILVVEVGNSEHALSDAFPEIPFTWLDVERGDGGIFLLTAKQLNECQDLIMDYTYARK
ncbi:MAG TPA: 50S ribosomal protein L3 N(5)-glutamine methyltransferase [Gammaproteobacteria bacterium]|nr:50S ribosomal protein L3 N(5)-glutamine methyltransferase [Gammaproteobacteria bacterium]